jgi:hypothetical protein
MNEDAQRIWDNGNHLISIKYYNYRISLYSVGKEFFEIFYNPESNTIEKINLATEDDLKKFLNRITINFS